jgi:hypothetical protein
MSVRVSWRVGLESCHNIRCGRIARSAAGGTTTRRPPRIRDNQYHSVGRWGQLAYRARAHLLSTESLTENGAFITEGFLLVTNQR